MLGMWQWEIYPNREVIVRWAGKLIIWWLYGTLVAILLYARGAPNVWSDYVFGWTCVASFVAACVLGSLALAMLKLLIIAIRRRYRATRHFKILTVGLQALRRPENASLL
jgi:hypothetical protein